MIRFLISYTIKVIVVLSLLFLIFCFADSCINGPGTPGECDTASQRELILGYGIFLLLWIPISVGLWRIVNIIKKGEAK